MSSVNSGAQHSAGIVPQSGTDVNNGKAKLYIVIVFIGKKDIKKKPHSSSMQKALM